MTTDNIIELPVGEPSTAETAVDDGQLTLGLTTADGRPLRPSRVHARFRLDDITRRRGLQHIAEIRARLAGPEATDTEVGTDGMAEVVDLPTERPRRAS